MTWSNLVNYTFEGRIETFVFLSLLDLSRIQKPSMSTLIFMAILLSTYVPYNPALL